MFKKFRFDPFRYGLFVDGGEPGGGGGNQDPPKGDPPKDDDKGKKDPFAVFQDEASFMSRVKREGKSQLEALAKEAGFDSVDAFKAAAKAKKDADEAAKSELEKEKARAEKAEGEKKAALEAANVRLVNAEIKVFAVQAGFVDPADAVALVDRTGVSVDDQGSVTGAKEAVEKLAKAKPHLVGAGSRKPGGSPGGAGNSTRQDGVPGESGDFGKKLAEKRAADAKKRDESAHNYFK